MKNAKRIASLLLALVMVFALAMTVSAERTEVTTLGSLLIKDNESVKASEKTFNAFKILDLKAYADGENGEIHTFEYVVPAELADFYAERYNADKNDAATFIVKVREGIEGAENLFDFAYAEAAAAEASAGIGLRGSFLRPSGCRQCHVPSKKASGADRHRLLCDLGASGNLQRRFLLHGNQYGRAS